LAARFFHRNYRYMLDRKRASRSLTVGLICCVVAIATLGATSHQLRDAATGRLAFRIWRAFSRDAHGGHYAALNGVRIYYETYGNGPPVLLLHGGLGSLEDMHHQIRALAADRFVIAPDSRAHGRSTDADEPLSYALMADDMIKLLDKLGVHQADIVGWSDGGIIGLEMAIHHPEHVRRLVIIGANYDVSGLKVVPPANADVPPRPALYARIAPDPAHWPVLYSKVTTMWRTQPHYDLQDLGRIVAPTLVIAGEHDVIRPEHTDKLASAIPGADEVIIAGGTHAVLAQKATAVNVLIVRFLQVSLQ
jgi:pimeloyl-ACP methyl ester carboxylesterase